MEKNNEVQSKRWVEERLAALDPAGEWQPDATRGLARLRERSGAGRERGRRWTWMAAAGLAACLCLMALSAPQAVARFCLECSAAIWKSVSAPAVESNRKAAPDFTLHDASGNPVTLTSYRGKVVLLNFWATWCPPCRTEIPWFTEFQKTYGEGDFAVLGVSLDEDGWESVRPYLERNRIGYRMTIGNGDIVAAFGGVETLPTTLIIDRQGRITSRHVGLAGQDDYRAAIEAILREGR